MEHGVHSEDRPNGVRALVISNPKKRNALDPELLDQLIAALRRPRADGEKVRALFVRGAGKSAFCSGYDIAALGDNISTEGPLPDQQLQRAMEALEAHDAPSVAYVNGPAFGAGCELACACDFRVGDAHAVFSMPPARLGIIYPPEGLQRVLALVGPSRAKRMFLLAQKLEAEEALRAGLLDELRPEDEAEEAANELCRELAAGAPLALAGMKRTFNWLAAPIRTVEEREMLERLRRAAFRSADAREGRSAFREKRAPRFKGH
ncbi:MAG TPA: enoyl-CoA hydratase/isomerase family protein [Myxococcales bacterium]|nr:enoyl-CoA hydratase/isomerase family protein [Myxococcales bacterium]